MSSADKPSHLRTQYTQLVDRNARSTVVDADLVKKKTYGQVMIFVEFLWEGESLILAIVEPYDSIPWLKIQNSPELLTQRRGWQALDVNVIAAPAGRIAIEVGEKWVAFETSMGGMTPDLISTEDGAVQVSPTSREASYRYQT